METQNLPSYHSTVSLQTQARITFGWSLMGMWLMYARLTLQLIRGFPQSGQQTIHNTHIYTYTYTTCWTLVLVHFPLLTRLCQCKEAAFKLCSNRRPLYCQNHAVRSQQEIVVEGMKDLLSRVLADQRPSCLPQKDQLMYNFRNLIQLHRSTVPHSSRDSLYVFQFPLIYIGGIQIPTCLIKSMS